MNTPRPLRALFSRLRKEDRGYTLIELTVAMAGLLIFLSFASPFMFKQIQEAQRTETRTDLQQHARTAMRSLVRELRQASELTQVTERPSGKNQLSFGSDLNGSGTVTSDERVTYYIKSGQLRRGPDKNQGQPIADDVQTIVFTFFGSNLTLDDNGDGIVSETELDVDLNGTWSAAELNQVTRIRVDLTVTAGPDTQTYTENVWLRNKAVG